MDSSIFDNVTVQRSGGFVITQTLKMYMRTMNYRGYFYDPTADVSSTQFVGPVIYLVWHEYLLTPFFLRAKTNLGLLVSRHRDAEWLSQTAAFEGFESFRGSSGRGGVGALKAIFSKINFAGLVITPDGPRGPRREMAAGAIFLASKLQVPLVPVGVGYDKPWRYQRAWDKFAVPTPGSRVRILIGPRIDIPADLSRDELERYRLSTQSSLNTLTEASEQWATDNRPRPTSSMIRRLPRARG